MSNKNKLILNIDKSIITKNNMSMNTMKEEEECFECEDCGGDEMASCSNCNLECCADCEIGGDDDSPEQLWICDTCYNKPKEEEEEEETNCATNTIHNLIELVGKLSEEINALEENKETNGVITIKDIHLYNIEYTEDGCLVLTPKNDY